VISFEPVKTFRIITSDDEEMGDVRPMTPDRAGMAELAQKDSVVDSQTAVLRIDNVAWVSSLPRYELSEGATS
jgi:hypothetical protein